MKLSFLGRSYDATVTEMETPQAATTARFRGTAYHLRRPLTVESAAKLPRRFRGIAY